MLVALSPAASCMAATQPGISGVSGVSQDVPRLKMHVVRRIGKHKGYSVDVRYPRFVGGSPAEVRRLNREIKRIIGMHIPTAPLPEDCFGYRCDFQACLVTPKFVSLAFNFDNDTGGISGDTFEVHLNAILYPHFKILKLKDVLDRKRVNYSKLARLAIPQLHRAQESDERDPKPSDLSAASFKDFTFDRQQFTFTVPAQSSEPAQIVQRVEIQYVTIAEMIGPNSLIRQISKVGKSSHRTRKPKRNTSATTTGT
jgi:hypothetical protein